MSKFRDNADAALDAAGISDASFADDPHNFLDALDVLEKVLEAEVEATNAPGPWDTKEGWRA